MQASDIPANKFPIPWANGAGGSYVRQIPVTSQIGVQDGAASLTDGFPPLTFVPTGGGGVPPFGEDANGILKEVTLWERWVQGGGAILPYDAAFSTAVGGYPAGAMVRTALLGSVWISMVDNNTDNPLSYGGNEGAKWFSFTLGLLRGTDTGTANAVVVTLPYTRDSLGFFDGYGFRIKKNAVNTGPVTIALNGFAAKPLIHGDGSSLLAGELPGSAYFTCVYDNGSGTFHLQSVGTRVGSANAASTGHVWIGGILLQWIVGPTDPADGSQPSYTMNWDIAFPNVCLIASVSMDLAAASATSDNYYQTAGWSASAVTVQRQAIASGTFSETTRAIAVGIGH